MIINQTHRFVFVHIPKAAGTTVTKVLSSLSHYRDLEVGGTSLGEAAKSYYFKRFGLRKHSRAEEIRKVMGKEEYEDFFSFAFVRNPFSRLASAFHFLKSFDGRPAPFKLEMEKIPDLDAFLVSDLWTAANPSRGPDAIFQPQARWLFSQGDEPRLLVGYVGKTEKIREDLAIILARIGAGRLPENVERANASPTYEMPLRWKSSVVDRVLEEYKRDFAMFDYPLGPPGT